MVLALVVSIVAAGALGGPHLYAWYQLAAGRTAVEQFHADDARSHLDACLIVWPGNVEAHLLGARAARLAGDFNAAEHHLREAQRLIDPPSDDVVLEWAMYRAAGGDVDNVERFLQDYIRSNPDRAAPAREALATGYMRGYRVLDTLNLLQQWLDARPNDVEALALRGDLYWLIGAQGKAADDYRRVVDMDPQRREDRERLAGGLIESGRFEEALKHLTVVRQWKPDDPWVETRVARCYEWLDRPDDARRTLDAVLAKHPDYGPALRERGRMLTQDGQAAEAEEWLRRAVAAIQQDYQANWALYEALQKEGKASDAQAQLARAEEIKDRDERFTEITTRKMNVQPRDPALHCELGLLFLKKGSKELGEQWLLSALSLDPHYRPAHEALANYYREMGDQEKAAYHLRESQAISPPSPLPKEP
jgi:tetratricopeptide (TPR) repeat protein